MVIISLDVSLYTGSSHTENPSDFNQRPLRYIIT